MVVTGSTCAKSVLGRASEELRSSVRCLGSATMRSLLLALLLSSKVQAQPADPAAPTKAGNAAAVLPDASSQPQASTDAGAAPEQQGVVSPSEAATIPGLAPVSAESPVYPQGYTPPPESAVDYGSYPASADYGSAPVTEELTDLEGSPGAREHDGFFLRLSIGPGAGRAHYKESVDGARTSTVEADGLAGMFDVCVGGRVVQNLIVHGSLMFTRFDSPTRNVDGVEDAAVHVTSSSTMLGGGASYYFMPLNVYLSTSLGLAWVFERREHDQLRTGTGVFIALAAGKEWWVGRSGDWGLGAALRTTFAAAPVDIAGVESTLKLGNIGVAFSATFN